jgi:ankyrin repeat protein
MSAFFQDPSSELSLLTACAFGTPKQVEDLLNDDVDIRTQDENGLNPYEVVLKRFGYPDYLPDEWAIVYTRLMLSNK